MQICITFATHSQHMFIIGYIFGDLEGIIKKVYFQHSVPKFLFLYLDYLRIKIIHQIVLNEKEKMYSLH